MVMKNFPRWNFDKKSKYSSSIIPIMWLGLLPGLHNLGNKPAMLRGNDTTCLRFERAYGVKPRLDIQTTYG